MRALVIDRPGAVALRDVNAPPPGRDCSIRVVMAGICGTDLQLLDGYAEFRGTPGHEFVGIVAAAPEEDAGWIGRRVVGEINVGCGDCAWCVAGTKEHCPRRTVTGIRGRSGAFAEFLSLPAGNLHEVPDAVDDETAVFVEPTAAACRILEQVALDVSARAAVLGDGRMGLLVAQVLRTATPHVTIVGRHDHKLAIASALGLEAQPAAVFAGSSPRFDLVVDATGRPQGMQHALGLVRPRGTIVLKSTFHGEASLAPWPLVVDEVTLVGSRCGPFQPALDLLASGAVRVHPLISHIAALEEYESAFVEARRAVKVLFAMSRSR